MLSFMAIVYITSDRSWLIIYTDDVVVLVKRFDSCIVEQ